MPFWYQLGSILPPKILQNTPKNHSQEASIFWSILTSIFERFGLQLGAILGPKLALCWEQNRIKIAPDGLKIDPDASQDALWSQNPPRNSPGLHFGRFWIDFGSILDRFWIDFGSILDRFLMDFGNSPTKANARWRERACRAEDMCIPFSCLKWMFRCTSLTYC